MADGRRFGWRGWGPDGAPVITALHGTPGSSLKFSVLGTLAAERGYRLIALDRWGYGRTSRHPMPSLSAFAADVAEVADRLRVRRFSIAGVSGGGPYAAAVAAVLGDRIEAAALISPVGPIAGSPATAGLSPFHKLCFRVLPRTPGVLFLAFRGFRRATQLSPWLARRLATGRAAAIDIRTISQPEVGDRLIATFREGLRPGVAGPLTDMSLFSRDWGVRLDAVTAPAVVFIGSDDRNVPIPAAERLARNIRGASLVTLPGEGHLWLATNAPAVLDWIDATRRSGD
ncbi:MAG TPA: alpha/beta hydrolase [Hyphomicrobiaceae bacterium]|nr:alpha/beta hydrolase [Hyphomicrobiaceae bacterium]